MPRSGKGTGNDLYKKKSLQAALDAYDMAIAACPNDLVYYNNKAAVLIELENLPECLKMCHGLVDRLHHIRHADPAGATDFKVARTLGRIATCFQRQQRYSKALEHWRLAHARHASPQTKKGIEECEIGLSQESV